MKPVDAITPDEIVDLLSMQPHPEGGWYVETFRDSAGGDRGHSTAIYYLLTRGDRSHWHRVIDAVEIWHWYGGSPLRLAIATSKSATPVDSVLGQDLRNGQRPQLVIPAGCWQSACSLGKWTLVGCTVAPGFAFGSFELAPADFVPGK